MPIFRGRDLRKGRYSTNSQIYHVTTVTRDRAPLFIEMRAARTVIQCMREQQEKREVDSLAFVVMPDHVHWLFQLRQDSLSHVMNIFKGRSSRAVSRQALAKAPVWQKGFYDHAIRSDESLQSVARYIVANPLRAGICKRIGDYPWWDAVWME